MFGGVAVYLLRISIAKEYPDLVGVILGSFFGVLALLCWGITYPLGALIIYDDRIVRNSILGRPNKVIPLEDIVKWDEIVSEKKDNRKVTIYTPTSKFSMSHLEQGYDELMQLVSGENLKRTSAFNDSAYAMNRFNRRERKYTKYALIVLFMLSGWLFWGGLDGYLNPDNDFRNLELSTVAGTITETPQKITPSKGGTHIDIQLKNFPNYTFEIYGNGCSATKSGYGKINSGDSVFIGISKDQYQKKITKEKGLSFFDKVINYHSINVYEFSNKDEKFLAIENYRIVEIKDNKLGFYIAVVGFSLMIGALWGIYKINKKKVD